MNTAEKVSVAPQQHSGQSLVSNKLSEKRSTNDTSANRKSDIRNKNSEIDLCKLLERANLIQYLAMFSEQGMFK